MMRGVIAKRLRRKALGETIGVPWVGYVYIKGVCYLAPATGKALYRKFKKAYKI
jgi:hypothetical protein